MCPIGEVSATALQKRDKIPEIKLRDNSIDAELSELLHRRSSSVHILLWINI